MFYMKLRAVKFDTVKSVPTQIRLFKKNHELVVIYIYLLNTPIMDTFNDSISIYYLLKIPNMRTAVGQRRSALFQIRKAELRIQRLTIKCSTVQY